MLSVIGWIGFVILAIILLVVFIKHQHETVVGVLRIDWTDPEKDIYRIEIEDLEVLSRKKKVVLKVINAETNSRK